VRDMVNKEDTQAAAPLSARLPRSLASLVPPRDSLLWISLVSLLVIGGLWLWFTPAGLLGKADAVGYAVCHRITVRSFLFPNGVQLPMCARCSGTFLGVLVGLFGPGLLLGRRRAAEFPKTWIVILMLGFSGWWAFDGANSFAHLLPSSLGIPRLFEPTNFLRLTTGMFHGITLGGLVLPVVNATIWADARREPTLASVWHLLALYAVGVALIAMVLSGLAVFLYPLAVASALGTLAALTGAGTVMAATLLKRENRAYTPGEALPLILLGLAGALALIGLIDLGRYALFGSWAGLDINQFSP